MHTTFKEIPQQAIDLLQEAVGQLFLFTDTATLQDYGHDETENLQYPPQVLVKPANTAQVAACVKIAHNFDLPVVTIGGRTGLSGGALSIHGGIAIAMERFNQIMDIDDKNLQVTTQPGVITQVLRDTLATHNLSYPVDPSSQGSCFIGGNVAENSGGARAVKYGVTSDYVLNLEVVLPDGSIIWTGANTLKNATGYNLTQLMVGSEGTLGIITTIVLKVVPVNPHNILMLVPFYRASQACEAVSAIFRAGIVPSALEFMERDAIDWTLKFMPEVQVPVQEKIQAHLLIEVDGTHQDVLFAEAEKIAEVLEAFELDEILFADTEDQKNALWKMRRAVAEAVKANSVYKEEDTVVPRYELPKLLAGVKAIGSKYGFQSVCYGHAGDGNLHINIIKGNMTEDAWQTQVPLGIKELFELTVSLKGTLSGEHGIGLVQKNYMPIAFSDLQLRLMWGIKQLFDPKNIMNPGKIFPDYITDIQK